MGVVRSMMAVIGAYYVLFIHASPDLIINLGCNSHFQPGVVNNNGYTPLGLAVMNERLKVVKYLIIEQNIDPKGK